MSFQIDVIFVFFFYKELCVKGAGKNWPINHHGIKIFLFPHKIQILMNLLQGVVN